jgi:4-hydroxy-tetrahydrodipicolinate reductase
MMKFAKEAAKYLTDVEIIEMHHDKKLDAPSGTGYKTAQMISEVRTAKVQGHPNEKETMAGARGAEMEGMRIHSVRLPGLVAHQQVLFGGEGELLTIRHDSMNRGSFMGGIAFCVEHVMTMDGLIYGLENII